MMNSRELIRKLISVACIFGTIGISLKLLTIVYQSGVQGYWHFFPIIPNIFDSMFLIFSVIWLALRR